MKKSLKNLQHALLNFSLLLLIFFILNQKKQDASQILKGQFDAFYRVAEPSLDIDDHDIQAAMNNAVKRWPDFSKLLDYALFQEQKKDSIVLEIQQSDKLDHSFYRVYWENTPPDFVLDGAPLRLDKISVQHLDLDTAWSPYSSFFSQSWLATLKKAQMLDVSLAHHFYVHKLSTCIGRTSICNWGAAEYVPTLLFKHNFVRKGEVFRAEIALGLFLFENENTYYLNGKKLPNRRGKGVFSLENSKKGLNQAHFCVDAHFKSDGVVEEFTAERVVGFWVD